MMKIMPYFIRYMKEMQSSGMLSETVDKEDAVITIDMAAMVESENEVVDVANEFLAEYINDMTGLKDANGNAINKETVIENAYFQTLVAEIIGQLMNISKPDQQQVDDLGKPQPVQLEASN